MNFPLSQMPSRTPQPRSTGLTVVSDKGLSLTECENYLSVSGPYIDRVKLAFGTALFTPRLQEKVNLFKEHQIPVYFGGLLFEAYAIRKQVKDFEKLVKDLGITHVEISDGNLSISHEEKCDLIKHFSGFTTVISEIGSKDQDRINITPPYKWIELMQKEMEAGAEYIVAEAKEMGNVGIYRDSGEVREGLIEEILTKIPQEKIIWEAPDKNQQLFFIKLLGCNANLANINPAEVIALEAMRIGLRGDSFEFFLDKN